MDAASQERYTPEDGFNRLSEIPGMTDEYLGPSKELWFIQVPTNVDLKSLSGSLKRSKHTDAEAGRLGDLHTSSGADFEVWQEHSALAKQLYCTTAKSSGSRRAQVLKVAKRLTVVPHSVSRPVEHVAVAPYKGGAEGSSQSGVQATESTEKKKEKKKEEKEKKEKKKKKKKKDKKDKKDKKEKKRETEEAVLEGSAKKKQKAF